MLLGQRALAPGVTSGLVHSRKRCVVVRADGVQDLLARDRKAPKVAKELLDNGKGAQPSKQRQVVKSRTQRRSDARERQADEDPNRPKRCKEAIDRGLALFQEKKYDEAIKLFNLALELPGNGAYRLPGSPREYSCPSEAEEHAALYNMACAYTQMGQQQSALTCLEAVLDSGFEDYQTIRTDPDLASLRGPKLDELLGRYDSPFAKIKKLLPNNDNKVLVSEPNKNKPWVLW